MRRDDAPIATPCGADWTAMSPRGKARLCGQCDKLVHDLSAMTERAARALLETRPTEGLCIRYLHDATGEIWFGARAERVVPASRLARRGAAAMSAAALLLVPVLTEACGGAAPDRNPYNYPFEADDGGTAPSLGSDRQAAQPTLASSGSEAGDAGSTGPDAAIDAPADVVPGAGGDGGVLTGDASGD
jgi:hypothetical protein